jgi:ornithine cyclodeaminase/alanine dehydrogenase-like protein (mu-crystallin family)
MVTILTDADVAKVDMRAAISAVARAFTAKSANALVAPPRHHVAFPGHGDLVFTIGGVTGDQPVAGFRVYERFESAVVNSGADRSQLVAVWDVASGALRGLVLGHTLGEIRTGAIGGLAIDVMAPRDASRAAVIGSGRQARTQLMAAAAIRPLRQVRVYSRSEANRDAFAHQMSVKLGLDVTAAGNARDAVKDADIVLCATDSATPAIEARWLKPGAHINTVGPKSQGAHEIGIDVVASAVLVATDSPDQARAYDPPFFLIGTPHMDRMIDLATIMAGRVIRRADSGGNTLFCSTGLAGTEVLVAAALLDAPARRG